MLTPSKFRTNSKQFTPSKSGSTSAKKPDAYFYEKIKQRERELRERKRKLALAKERLQKNMELLESERDRILACFSDAAQISPKVKKQKKSSLVVEPNDEYLYRLAEEIRQQLIFAMRELDELKTKNQKNSQNKEIQGSEYIVTSLQELLKKVNDDVFSRENEVIEAEMQVALKKQEEKTNEIRKQDEERRIILLHKKIKHAEKKKAAVFEKNKKAEECVQIAKKTLEDAKLKRDSLDSKETEIENLQKAINEKTKRNEEITEKIKKMQKSTASIDAERRECEKMCTPDTTDETPTLQEVENMKREVARAKDKLDASLKRIETLGADVRAKAEIENMTNLLNAALDENKLLNEETQKSTIDDRDGLKQQVAEKFAEINRLQSMILSDDVLETRDLMLRNEQKALLTRERELSERNAELRTREDEIESEEMSVMQTEDDLTREKKLAEMKNNHSNKMLEIYKLQKKAADERYEELMKKIVAMREKNNQKQ